MKSMKISEVWLEVAEMADVHVEMVKKVLEAFSSMAAGALLRGRDVPLGNDLGKLIVRRKNGKLIVDFKPSKVFKIARMEV